jgi:hypothetical protein
MGQINGQAMVIAIPLCRDFMIDLSISNHLQLVSETFVVFTTKLEKELS